MSQHPIITRTKKNIPCLILIGMPGAGKTTLGKQLANRLNWPYLDSDYLIEACYGRRLQDIVDATDKESFLDLECDVVCSIRAHRCVLGTGGSVIYRKPAMEHLKKLGLIVHLDVPLAVLKERIGANPERGIAQAPGQSLADLYKERKALYKRWSDFSCNNSAMSISETIQTILRQIPKDFKDDESTALASWERLK